ncbi:MAG: hypothetical protein PGN13_00030 [Patulibacter minatonensis]
MTLPSSTSVGDPEAMRALARELLGRADLVATGGAAGALALDGATFEGPAAERLRGTLTDARTQVQQVADRMREIAGDLAADASIVEDLNAQLAKAAAEAAEAAKTPTTPTDPAPPAAPAGTTAPSSDPVPPNEPAPPAEATAPPVEPAPADPDEDL